MDKAQRKIFRSPSVKRKNKGLQILQKLTLERVLGLTVTSNAALSCDPNTGTIAYPAGCVVVLFNPRRNRQSHIFNTTKKTITSVAFSCDGKHLVTGECGHQPAVRVWDVSEKTQIAEFHGHKFGINCVAFSPNLKYIVSVGSQYDMMVNVWNWRTGNKVASNKVSCKVCAVAFSTDSGYFVTVGNRHVKFWYLDCNKSKINQTVPLLGRSGILGEQRNNFFSDVVCGRGPSASSTFVITQSGLLCEFNEKRLLDKWVELRTKSANCLTAGEEHIYVGCAEGVVRVFSANSLHFVTTLPHPHHLGVEVATATSSSDMICTRTDAKYPDTIAIAIDDHCKVACIYNDHSLYVWDVVNVRRVGKAWSFLYHSGCIWALEVYPRLESPQTGVLPPGSFITSSSDDTIRVWNLDSQMSETAEYKRNIYSNELLKVIYTDPSLAYLCDVNFNPAGATDKTDTTWEGKNGVRSIRVSPDGEHLASGDRQGNVRIYDMHQMAEIRSIEAHESDVVCLEYSFSKAGPRILASGSRDRLIHVFDVEQKYGLLQTLDDHSAAIQAVRFTDANNRLRMLSCGSDKSLLFRNVNLNPSFEFVLDQHLVSKATMYDMIIDPTQKFVATACQDRNIRVYNMATAKQKKNYRASCGDEGVLLRVQLDPSGTYAATSCSDKNLCILEFYTGEIICSVNGHSEISTGLRFTNDLKHLISVSADGCIFVWRLPSDMTKTMRLRMEELGKLPQEDSSIDLRREVTLMPNPVTLDISFQDLQHFPVMKENISPARVLSYMAGSATPKGKGTTNSVQPSPADYCFSIGPLPNWAKIRFGDSTGEGIDGNADALQPKGRWAQRFDQNMAFKSQLDLTQLDDEIDRTSEGKLSVSRQTSLPDLRRETVVLSQQHLPLKNIPIIDDDDETNVDDDEEFLPAYFSSQSSNINVESDRSSSDYGDKKSKHRSDSAGRPIDATTTGRNLGSRLSLSLDKTNTNSFDLDDTDDPDSWSDTTEVIYPPNDAETLDTYASTYKVFAVDENGSHSKVRAKQTTLSSPTADEGDSESTDPVSLEDHEDEDAVDDTMITSTASTPSDPEREFPRTPDKEQFVKENFETDAFTPLPIDKFHQQMATLERAADVIDPSNLPFSPRLSLSSRFLSRSQFGIRSLGRVAQRSDDWYDPLRKSKSEIARAMDETRRRLTDINWHSNDVLKNSPEKEDPPSPPTKLENNEPNFSSSPKVSIVSSIASTPSPRTLRRFWADFTLPQQPIKEENSLPRISLPQSLQHMKGDSANTLVTSVNSSKIPLFAAQAADGIELNSGFVCSPTLTKSFRRPVSPDSRFPQSPKLTRSHDQKPVGVVPVVGSRTSSNPQSLHLSRSRITTRPPRPPQSPPSPKPPPSPTSPRSSSCPSSPRPPRSPFSCRSSRSVQSSDVSLQSPKSPRPPRSPLSSRPPLSPLSPDLRSSRNPLPPKALLQFRKIQSSNTGNLPSPTGSPTLDRKGSHSFLQQPPKKPPRSSLNSRSKSPPNSESIRTPSPSIKSESIRSQSPSTRSSESIRSQSPSVKSSESIRSQSPSVKSSDSNRSRSPSTRSSESIRSQSPSVKSSDSIRTPSPNIKSESIRSQSPSVKSSESICSQYSSTRSSETICSQSSNTKSLDSFRLATPTIKSSENIHLVFHSTTTNSDVTEVCESDQLCQQSPEVQKKGSGLEMAITAAGTKGEADNIKSTSVTSPNHIRSTVTARERRRSIIGSRTGEVTSSGSTRSGEVTGGTGTRTGEHSSNSSAAVRQVPSYFRTTKSSRLKSASSSNLMGPFDSQSAKSTVISNKAETGVKKKTGRSRLSSSNHLALYASTPNLTVYHEEVDDIERAIQKTSNLKTLTELSLSVPDINALDDLKSTDSSSPSLPVTGFKDSAGVKQTIKTCSPSVISRLAPDKLANTDFHMDDSGLSNPRSVFQPPNSELMPPPPIGTPLKSTQTNFLRRSVQIRNRSTAELTLEQAKSILLGNSGILCRQTSNEDVPLTSTLPNKKNTYTKSSGTLQKNIPCSKTLTSPLSSLTNVSSHANSTSSSVFEPLETDTLPETGFTSATTLAVAEEIERTASRLRRERVAATALGAARYDPPERDRPQTHKVVNPIKIITSSHSHGASLDKNKEGGKALDRNKEGGKALDKNKEDGKALDKNKEGEKALDLRLSVSPTIKESEELTVKERVARFNQQTVTQTTVEVSHPIHNSIGLSPRNIRVTTSSPLPPDFLGSPRSQSDTGLGSETDTDSEPRHHQVSGLGSSLSRVNRSHLSLHLHNSASPSSTASSASSTASAASDHGVPTESLQICTSILADLRQAVQRAKEFHTQVHSGGSNTVGYQQMMVLMSEAFHEAHLTLAHLALQSPVLPESSTKPPSCPLVEVTGSWDQTVMEKAQDMLQPFVSQLSQELSDELVKLVKDKLQGNPQ